MKPSIKQTPIFLVLMILFSIGLNAQFVIDSELITENLTDVSGNPVTPAQNPNHVYTSWRSAGCATIPLPYIEYDVTAIPDSATYYSDADSTVQS
ncbi:hypothetical protein MASR2M64_03430 [Candidatus Cloacimonadota bacterium]